MAIISLSKNDVQLLNEALHYMNMIELRALCTYYGLTIKGNKVFLIRSIMAFIQTGAITPPIRLPNISKAQKNACYPLDPDTLMLYGSYKNDAKTRAFFKQLIGPHFHFTAFGIDWINERWRTGNPPTYQEFAQFWQKEYRLRLSVPVPPKKEWAYINFTQQLLKQYPEASKDEINKAWDQYRMEQVALVKKILKL